MIIGNTAKFFSAGMKACYFDFLNTSALETFPPTNQKLTKQQKKGEVLPINTEVIRKRSYRALSEN